jgi:transposase InsO family protein
MAAIVKLPSGSWRAQVRRKGKYLTGTFLRKKDAEEWGLKIERTDRKVYHSRNQARADVFDFIERFYNPKRRHSTIGYLSPIEFERRAEVS